MVSVECQEHTFVVVQLGSLLLPTPWLSCKFLEEGSALCFALWEQVSITTKLQHWKITRWYHPFFKAGRQKIRRKKKGGCTREFTSMCRKGGTRFHKGNKLRCTAFSVTFHFAIQAGPFWSQWESFHCFQEVLEQDHPIVWVADT